MELKDVILSTLAEMQEDEPVKKVSLNLSEPQKIEIIKKPQKISIPEPMILSSESILKKTQVPVVPVVEESNDSELLFLNSFKERLLVLFEGFQAPNNKDIDAKVDMTLNFLEYALATIETRSKELSKGKIG